MKTKEYLVGECKFKGSPFQYGEYLDTVAKLTPKKKTLISIMHYFRSLDLMKKSEKRQNSLRI